MPGDKSTMGGKNSTEITHMARIQKLVSSLIRGNVSIIIAFNYRNVQWTRIPHWCFYRRLFIIYFDDSLVSKRLKPEKIFKFNMELANDIELSF